MAFGLWDERASAKPTLSILQLKSHPIRDFRRDSSISTIILMPGSTTTPTPSFCNSVRMRCAPTAVKPRITFTRLVSTVNASPMPSPYCENATDANCMSLIPITAKFRLRQVRPKSICEYSNSVRLHRRISWLPQATRANWKTATQQKQIRPKIRRAEVIGRMPRGAPNSPVMLMNLMAKNMITRKLRMMLKGFR